MRFSGEARDLTAASAFSALLFATGALVPLLGPPAGFFASAPLIWVAGRHGPIAGILGGILAAAALLPALPPPVSLIFALEHALPAWYLGWAISRGRGLLASSALAALVVTVLVIASALLLVGRGHDPVGALEQQLRQGLTELGGGAGGDEQAAMAASLDEVLALMRRVLPAVTLIGIFLECSLNSLLAARVLARHDAASKPRNLNGLRAPEWLIWVLILVLAACWAPQRALATVALNVLLPLLFAYLLVGLSIASHLSTRAHLTRLGRTMFIVGLIFFPWLLVAPLLLGLLDFRFGFRERWPIEPPPPA